MIIVDEVSMVSSLNFAYMHLRLEELFGGHSWFGGKNVIFVGDLLLTVVLCLKSYPKNHYATNLAVRHQ